MHPDVSWFLALGAGLLSFFTPCVLPLLPAYLSFITGVTVEEILEERPARKTILPNVILFCLGFSLIFILMGATASAIGQAIYRYQRIIQWVGGILIILFGLHLLGVFQLRIMQMDRRLHLSSRPAHGLAAFLIGIGFAVGWSPCIGPILGSILAYAGTRETLMQGIVLLALYALGLSIPFVAVGFAIGSFIPWFTAAKRVVRWVNMGAGALLIIMGLLLITDNLGAVYRWFE
jgi:cytochrome c-type biogenesis protein